MPHKKLNLNVPQRGIKVTSMMVYFDRSILDEVLLFKLPRALSRCTDGALQPVSYFGKPYAGHRGKKMDLR